MKKNSILIIDDEKANIITLTHMLSPEYTIYAAKDGKGGIELANEFLPDVILLDILMPDIDGYDAIAALKNSDSTREIPVIFITGLTKSSDEEKGLALGASDYITKPFSSAVVKLRIKNQIKILEQRMTEYNLMRLEKALEQSNAVNKAKSEFLSNMSHEMRTPMNAIMGMTDIAMKAADGEQKDQALKRIRDASAHLLNVIDDVLDMAKIESNKLEIVSAEYDFELMLRKVLAVMSFRVDEKKQRLTVNADSGIPRLLVGDDRRLAQVITHLLSNAIKFTPEGGNISLSASFSEADDGRGGGELRLEVADDGIGISEGQQEKLFRAFEQAESGTSRRYGGMGLGLVISKNIIELMGGAISVESELGKGARFVFTVKAGRGGNPQESLSSGESGDGAESSDDDYDYEGSFVGKKLLLAEDIEINREILIAMLEYTGLSIDCAENGVEALDTIAADPGKYDAVFMDLQMPIMDGLEATRRIRALQEPQCATLPIIAMTANVFEDDVEACITAGMDDHVGKPLDIAAVLKTLRKYLGS